MQAIRFGDTRLPKRFWSKIKVEDDGCWAWTATQNVKGYGFFYWNGRMRRAHRVAYEMLAKQIPSALQCDHICRVRNCCNPAHIDLVTSRENTNRGDIGRIEKKKTHCPRNHPYSGNNVYVDKKGGRNCRSCVRIRSKERREREKQANGGSEGTGGRDMSGGVSCKCQRPERVVTMRNCNYSAFNGYRFTPSRYSQVKCVQCGATWRSRAAYVDALPDATPEEPES